MRNTTIIRSLTLTAALLVAQTASAAIYTWSATGSPTTTGTDPFGNQYQISQFGSNTVLSLPGYPHLFAGLGLMNWLGPDCLVSMTVEAFTAGATAPQPLTIDTFSDFHHTTTPSGVVTWNKAFSGPNSNTVTFNAPTLDDMGRSASLGVFADHLNIAAHAINPGGGAVRFDVTYETFDHVPEPSTWALLGSALVGLARFRKRR